MKIEKIYVGGWFQRTMLHLTEIYDFLVNGSSRLNLDEEKLLELRQALEIKEVKFFSDGFDRIEMVTTNGIEFKMLEDGVIILSSNIVKKDTLLTDINVLTDYYETKLSPAISYLFSLGAPVPKELANIKTIYPYFIVLKNAKIESIKDMLLGVDKQKYHEHRSEKFDVFRGDKYFFINTKKAPFESIEKFIEEQIFIREFKGQTHRYLNLHRIIWEKVAAIKERKKIRGKEIIFLNSQIEDYSKTVNLVDTRINQMGTYLKTREKLAKSDDSFKDFINVMEYRYETLGNTLSYVQQVWSMTKNYISSAKSMFNGLQNKITQNSLKSLTLITALSFSSTLLSFVTKPAAKITSFGLIFLAAAIVVGYGLNFTIKLIAESRKYKVSAKEYEKFSDK